MKVAIPRERREGETRVAASIDTVKKLTALGLDVVVEKGAGAGASIPDAAYKDAGATIAKTAEDALKGADVILKVRAPLVEEVPLMKSGAVLVAIMNPYREAAVLVACAAQGVDSFAMELMPRITRAQTMDILSSQANLAGYKAVIDAAATFTRAMPMMMTAAGTIAPAKVFVMGAGVAGLQAIATARRLGSVVSATDVRPAAKEQVESLGASFVMVESEETKAAETSGGYAREMSEDYKRKQAELISETIRKQDIVICTALIPGRPAPLLVSEAHVKSMKPGSVIVDLAVEQGGNCALSEPGKVVDVGGVTIIGHLNMPGRIAVDASNLYARNLFNFLSTLIDKETKALKIDWADELVTATNLTRGGAIVHPQFQPAATPATADTSAGTGAGSGEGEGR
ncbi:MAG: Re/Si-specific NAD(P)(+) transhydrogenase subunit alpha [Alphaproteobacteria bacterium]|nr:Re/Si-specific NAD(P)(+) transhydrogenase subunit alpha [Alphaproteobacteria bacterium]